MLRPLLVCALASLVASAAVAQGAASRPRTIQLPKYDVELQLPADWEVEPLDHDTLLLLDPVAEAGWQTNVVLARAVDRHPDRTHDEMIDDLVANYGRSKKRFALKHAKPLRHPSGLRCTELLYTHTREGLPLTEKELVFRLGGSDLLIVTGSVATPLWRKYAPRIDAVLVSIRPLSAPASASPRAGSPPRRRP